MHVENKPLLASIPKRRRLPDQISGVPVDVVVNVFRSAACPANGAKYRIRRDSLFGGIAIGPCDTADMGTLGIVVVDGDQAEHVLTCAHVVNDQLGLDIVQPHGVNAANLIGKVIDRAWNSNMDAAVVRLSGARVAGAGVLGIGAVDGVPFDVPQHWKAIPVTFAGACSGRRTGVMMSASFSGEVQTPSGTMTVVDHLVIESKDSDPLPMGRQGDSGALVIYQGQAIGLVSAVSDDPSGTVLAARVVPILKKFAMRIAT
ncbi:MAG: hypothetical protein ACREJO_15620 [Phycisphaerales bacterium]